MISQYTGVYSCRAIFFCLVWKKKKALALFMCTEAMEIGGYNSLFSKYNKDHQYTETIVSKGIISSLRNSFHYKISTTLY